MGQVIDFRTPDAAKRSHIEISQVDSNRKSGPPLSKGIPEELRMENRVWPVIRFINGREVLCVPTEFTVVNVNGVVEAQRDQVRVLIVLLSDVDLCYRYPSFSPGR